MCRGGRAIQKLYLHTWSLKYSGPVQVKMIHVLTVSHDNWKSVVSSQLSWWAIGGIPVNRPAIRR